MEDCAVTSPKDRSEVIFEPVGAPTSATHNRPVPQMLNNFKTDAVTAIAGEQSTTHASRAGRYLSQFFGMGPDCN